MLSLLSVQTAQAADKLTISSASASIAPYSTNYVTNVYDGNTSTIYWSNGPQTSSTYVQVVLQEESNIGSVKLYFVKDDQPDGGTISYSTDGSNWTVAKTFENSEISSSDYLYSCDIDGAPLAKYVRLTLTSPHSGWWFRLAEFEVYPPSVNQASVTFHYNAGGTYQFDVVKTYEIGTTLTLPEVNDITFYKDFAFNTEDLTVSATNKEFTVTCTPDFPFTEGIACKMFGANSDGTKNANASSYCFTARTDNNITYQGVKNAIDANSYWIFEHVAGTENQFYVYNMGVDKYLSSRTSRSTAIMADKGNAGTAVQIFRITPNGDGFNLQHQRDTNCCGTHINGGSENPYLGTAWGSSTDPGHSASRVYIMDIAPELAALGNDPTTTEGYVGEGPSQVLKTAAEAAGTAPTQANVVACLDAYNNPTLADYVAADKYYQIFFEGSDGANQALALNGATEAYSAGAFTLTPGTVSAVSESGISQTDNIASIYQFTQGTSGMVVTNVNAQVAWGTVSTSGLEGTTGTGTEYPFAVVSGQSNNSYWNIATGTGHLVLDGTAVKNSTSDAATARLKEVTSIPVTIKSTLWTSLCFPVDVVIPSNLKAYKAASTQGMTINLEELAAGSRIPAGNGFLALAEAGGDYSFAIATGSEAEADLSGNQFTGATVKRAGMDGVDYFALATKKTVTGFYKVTTGTVPANKAYLLGDKLNQGAGANMLQFAFGEGTETGISNVNAENSGKAETYYDLNGRLVAYPTRGVYVTGSGRKVFVK
ncbi:MAG: discoidin domain-containing protein [Bacteroidales bacterium]|nr:discoidin domain-containing protein [Bacteroidales bacterium]